MRVWKLTSSHKMSERPRRRRSCHLTGPLGSGAAIYSQGVVSGGFVNSAVTPTQPDDNLSDTTDRRMVNWSQSITNGIVRKRLDNAHLIGRYQALEIDSCHSFRLS